MAFGEIAKETRNPRVSLKDEIKNEILQPNKEKESLQYSKNIFICGVNGTGKTTLALDLLCNDLAKDEMVIYVDIDNSGKEIISKFFKNLWDNDNIKHANTYESKIEVRNVKGEEKEVEVRDEEAILDKTTTTAAAIKDLMDEGYKIKGVIVDGVSFILEYAEKKMRIEKNLSVDQGVNTLMWKVRNSHFRDFYSPYMNLPCPVVFVGHNDFIRKPTDEKDLSSVKQRFIDECSVRIETGISTTNNITDYYGIIQKDRSSAINVGAKYTFLTINASDEMRENDAAPLYYAEDISENIKKAIFDL